MNQIEPQLPEEITITWHWSDIKADHPRLSEDDAKQVLLMLKRCHDCNIGINWDVISDTVSNMGL